MVEAVDVCAGGGAVLKQPGGGGGGDVSVGGVAGEREQLREERRAGGRRADGVRGVVQSAVPVAVAHRAGVRTRLEHPAVWVGLGADDVFAVGRVARRRVAALQHPRRVALQHVAVARAPPLRVGQVHRVRQRRHARARVRNVYLIRPEAGGRASGAGDVALLLAEGVGPGQALVQVGAVAGQLVRRQQHARQVARDPARSRGRWAVGGGLGGWGVAVGRRGARTSSPSRRSSG